MTRSRRFHRKTSAAHANDDANAKTNVNAELTRFVHLVFFFFSVFFMDSGPTRSRICLNPPRMPSTAHPGLPRCHVSPANDHRPCPLGPGTAIRSRINTTHRTSKLPPATCTGLPRPVPRLHHRASNWPPRIQLGPPCCVMAHYAPPPITCLNTTAHRMSPPTPHLNTNHCPPNTAAPPQYRPTTRHHLSTATTCRHPRHSSTLPLPTQLGHALPPITTTTPHRCPPNSAARTATHHHHGPSPVTAHPIPHQTRLACLCYHHASNLPHLATWHDICIYLCIYLLLYVFFHIILVLICILLTT
jgi:hypothetical protein